jgi:NAD(P)-dependent dehydrogenase (short-subunit alcohol dehydrogenase family)
MMLNGKVVVVTGGAGLLGRSFVRAIVDHGGIAIIADRDLEGASRVAASLPAELRDRATPAALDITDESSVRRLVDVLRTQHARVDAVVNNAYPRNARYGRRLEEVTYADFCDNISTHVGGYFLVSQQFGALFAEQRSGTIVNMGSIYGVVAPRFEVYAGTGMTMPVEYAAIKAAVTHLSRYFAQYFKSDGVRVNTISPGGIFDGQSPTFVDAYSAHTGTGRMLMPSSVASVLVFLLSDLSASITGQNIVVDEGWSL